MLATICGGGTVMTLASLNRVDAAAGQPVVQPHRMGAGGEGLREGVFALVGRHQLGQAGHVGRALVGQLLRQRECLAVVVEVHQDGHVLLRSADAQMHAVDQAVQHVRHVQFAATSLSRTPAQEASLVGMILTPYFSSNLLHRGHHHAGAVGQRDEADADFLLFRASASPDQLAQKNTNQ
jgi:hypothetical protein